LKIIFLPTKVAPPENLKEEGSRGKEKRGRIRNRKPKMGGLISSKCLPLILQLDLESQVRSRLTKDSIGIKKGTASVFQKRTPPPDRSEEDTRESLGEKSERLRNTGGTTVWKSL